MLWRMDKSFWTKICHNKIMIMTKASSYWDKPIPEIPRMLVMLTSVRCRPPPDWRQEKLSKTLSPSISGYVSPGSDSWPWIWGYFTLSSLIPIIFWQIIKLTTFICLDQNNLRRCRRDCEGDAKHVTWVQDLLYSMRFAGHGLGVNP